MAMHAYGHEWACQLIYNPRLIEGLGLSDGEGTERLWSHFIKLIGIQNDMVTDLGDWLRHRLKKGIHDQSSVAREVLDQCELNVSELRKQWSNQHSAQLSIRACRL